MKLLRPSELRDFFFATVPPELLDDVAQVVLRAWKAAADHCLETYPHEEARDLFPYERRAKLDSSLKARLARYEGVTVESKHNAARNCWHTEVRIGRVVMTVSAVARPSEMVRVARFRESLAATAQAHLWEKERPRSEDDVLYAMLAHGPLGGSRILRVPTFVHVGFPDAECKAYLDRFDLASYLPEETAEQMRREQPKVRRVEKKKAE